MQSDLSDLYSTYLFFHSAGSDSAAKKIANEGSGWARTFWRKEDMRAYMFR